MKNETFEKTTRNPLKNFFYAIFTVIIFITVLSLPIIVTLINTRNTAQAEKKVASVNTAFSSYWKEFIRVMDENYSYVELYLDNDDITTIQGYVRDTDLENIEITFYDAIRNGDTNAYINGNRTYTVNVENMTKMYAYKNDRIVKMVKVEK